MKWQGWSSNLEQVDTTRVVAALLSSLNDYGQTAKSVTDVLDELGLVPRNSAQLALHLAADVGLFDVDALSMAAGEDDLLITAAGREVAAEFRVAMQPLPRRRAVRRALIRWLDEDNDPSSNQQLLEHPHGWFYGRRFSVEELGKAVNYLRDKGLIEGTPTMQGPLLRPRLTTLGRTCAERYDADIDEMERNQMSGGGVFNQYGGTIGNAAAGPVGSQHASVTVTSGQSAADLLAILEAAATLNWIPAEYADETEQVSGDLAAAAAGSADVQPAVHRAHRLFQAVSGFANTNPAAVALLTAGGNFAAVKLGVSTS